MPNELGLADYLTANEVADMLNIHINTVYRLCKNGDLPSFKFGRNLRISTDDLLDYIKKQKEVS